METITTPHGTFTVYLNFLGPSKCKMAHISFVDNHNKAHVILMQKTNDKWDFANLDCLPEWILVLKQQFQAMIKKTYNTIRHY